MTNLDLQSAISPTIVILFKFVGIILLCIFLSWGLYRILYYFLIEKGGRDRIITKINTSQTIKKVVYFFAPESNFLTPQTKTTDQLKENWQIEITFREYAEQAIVKCRKEEIIFDGRRALLIRFFYENPDKPKTFHDYNGWINNIKKGSFSIVSGLFRQEIKDINQRFKKDSDYILSLINKVNNTDKNSTKASFYKYLPIFKK